MEKNISAPQPPPLTGTNGGISKSCPWVLRGQTRKQQKLSQVKFAFSQYLQYHTPKGPVKLSHFKKSQMIKAM